MLLRLLSLLLLASSTYTLSAQSASPTKDCSISSLQICALHVAQDEAGIVTAPLHLKTSNFLWIAPFAAGVGYAITKDSDAMQKLGVDTKREDRFSKISDVGGLY